MYTVYVIKSISKEFTYAGFTDNLERRLFQHNSGFNRSTKPYLPFKLEYTEVVQTSTEAKKRDNIFEKRKRKRIFKSYNMLRKINPI